MKFYKALVNRSQVAVQNAKCSKASESQFSLISIMLYIHHISGFVSCCYCKYPTKAGWHNLSHAVLLSSLRVILGIIFAVSIGTGEEAEQKVLQSVVGVSAALYDLRVGNQHLFLLHGLDSETGEPQYFHNASLWRKCTGPTVNSTTLYYPHRPRSTATRILRPLCHDVCVGGWVWVCMLAR